MGAVICCNEDQKNELTEKGLPADGAIIWVSSPNDFLAYKNATVFVDLLFDGTPERIDLLAQLLPATVVVNSVVTTLACIHPQFIRVNGWPTFMSGEMLEAASSGSENKAVVEQAFSVFGKGIEWLPDVAGFISARIVCAIINEAFFALEDGVSTREEVDTAMKLGTAYPYGPLEWGGKIGLQNVVQLLTKLSAAQPRYAPSALLVKEANNTL